MISHYVTKRIEYPLLYVICRLRVVRRIYTKASEEIVRVIFLKFFDIVRLFKHNEKRAATTNKTIVKLRILETFFCLLENRRFFAICIK